MSFRHEKGKHPDMMCANFRDEDESNAEALSTETEDYLFNYHSGKLSYGLLLFEFHDSIKEGDGDRLFDLYKLALLVYKQNGHSKYAYVVLLYIVKVISILPEAEALDYKWNRFFNKKGRKGSNIPLDLKKEQQNRVLKTMWRALGPNLNESNAERTAKSLEFVDLVFESVDNDCTQVTRSGNRSVINQMECIQQIVADLSSKQVFKKTPGREGHPSFPKFPNNLLADLDYRDLHKWLKEHIDLWGSIIL